MNCQTNYGNCSYNMNMKIFGERVKNELKQQKLTQKVLAERLSVLPSTLCEWLNDNNEPPMQTIVDIALILQVSTDYLLGIKDYD